LVCGYFDGVVLWVEVGPFQVEDFAGSSVGVFDGHHERDDFRTESAH